MNEKPEEQLDAALNGEPNACANADEEFGDLLQVAAAIRDLGRRDWPTVEGVQRGRARLMAALVAQRRTVLVGRIKWIQWFNALLVPFVRPQRLAAALTVVVLILVSSRVLAASAESLPGDPLYDLKRIQEQVTLTFALSDLARESLREEFQHERARELQLVQQQHRVTRTQLEGVVERVDQMALTVSSVTMQLNRGALGDLSLLIVGAHVSVVVQSNGDGSLEAISITFLPAAYFPEDSGAPPTAASSAMRTPTSPPPRSTPEATHFPGGIATSEPTHFPSATPTAVSPTASAPTAEPTRRPEPTRNNDGTATPEPTRHAEATRTPQPTSTPEPTRTVEPTGTSQPSRTPEPTRTEQPSRTPEPTQTRQATETPRPTRTTQPTQVPASSPTSDDHQAATPTETPRPTQTQEPTRTATAIEPSRTPEPTRTGSPSN